jgi:hypothetical protein
VLTEYDSSVSNGGAVDATTAGLAASAAAAAPPSGCRHTCAERKHTRGAVSASLMHRCVAHASLMQHKHHLARWLRRGRGTGGGQPVQVMPDAGGGTRRCSMSRAGSIRWDSPAGSARACTRPAASAAPWPPAGAPPSPAPPPPHPPCRSLRPPETSVQSAAPSKETSASASSPSSAHTDWPPSARQHGINLDVLGSAAGGIVPCFWARVLGGAHDGRTPPWPPARRHSAAPAAWRSPPPAVHPSHSTRRPARRLRARPTAAAARPRSPPATRHAPTGSVPASQLGLQYRSSEIWAHGCLNPGFTTWLS